MMNDRKPGVTYHLEVGLRRLAPGRQIITDEDRVGRVEAECLHAAEVQLAAGGVPIIRSLRELPDLIGSAVVEHRP